MTLSEVRCFLAVAETLSFTEAARIQFFSQQAVSKYVMSLEAELGVTLFDRNKNGITLTDAGRYYKNFFQTEIENGKQLVKEVAAESIHREMNFRIGYSVWINPFCEIDRWISQFRMEHPLTMFTGEAHHNERLFQKLLNDELDVALISGAQFFSNPGLESVEIAPEEICLCVREELCSDTLDVNCWGLPMIQVSSWNWNPLEWKYIDEVELRSIGLSPNGVKLLPNLQSMLLELMNGKSVAILDRRFGFANTLKSVKAFPITLSSNSSLCCIWKKDKNHPLIAPFVETLLSLCQQQ